MGRAGGTAQAAAAGQASPVPGDVYLYTDEDTRHRPSWRESYVVLSEPHDEDTGASTGDVTFNVSFKETVVDVFCLESMKASRCAVKLLELLVEMGYYTLISGR